VNADVRKSTARRKNGLTDVERRRNADRLDRDVNAGTVRERHDLINGGSFRAVDRRRRPELFGDPQPICVKIDHQDRHW